MKKKDHTIYKRIYNKLPVLDITQDNAIPELINIMNSVKVNTKEAKLNATSISDNNGGRIIL